MTHDKLKDKLATLPLLPGCYLMKNEAGTIIYVGKAKKLKNRVNQYFHGAHNYKTTKMVSNIDDFEFIVTRSEKEALILENNLIKKYRPRFNILMMDDKTYPYLRISSEKNPRFILVRNTDDKKAKHFGPFSDSGAAYTVMKLLNRLYPLRKCKALPKRACLYYHLNQCLGPCINEIDPSAYTSIVEDITGFLKGDTKDILAKLTQEMEAASLELDFEKAMELRDLIQSIEHIGDKQQVELHSNKDIDVFNYCVDNGYISISGLLIRGGKLLERNSQIFELYDEPSDVFSSYLMQYYAHNLVPDILYLPTEIDGDVIGESLNIKVVYPQKGEKNKLIVLAKNNAQIQLKHKFEVALRKNEQNTDSWHELGEILSLSSFHRLEMFDNSHLNGSDRVSGMIVVDDGEFNKSEYRKFKIQGDELDDLGMMKEVIYRRYQRLLREGKQMPDLLLVDGGYNQIMAAKEIVEALELDIPIAGLVKDDKHTTNNLMDSNGEILPVVRGSNLFYFLTRLQDEVHRYAISFHKQQRSSHLQKSILDDVPGIGEVRKKALYKRFKSIRAMEAASVEELSEVIPIESAKVLLELLKTK